MVVLGFDGVDPNLLERYATKLPNLSRLMKANGGRSYRRLGSTNPPQSPVAWTSFATGTHPGEHGIFDFIGRRLHREPTGLPVTPFPSTTTFEPQAAGPPAARNLRTGQPFWQLLANDGVRVVALNVPYSFPPDPMREGRMLSGLGVPDIRGTNSTFTLVGTDVTDEQAHSPPGGGALVPLRLENGTGRFSLDGPRLANGTKLSVEVTVETNAAPPGQAGGSGFAIAVGGARTMLQRRHVSDWVELTFEGEGQSVRGIAQFLLLETGARTRIFVTPISFHPRAPYSPITYPNAYAGQIADAIESLYKTVGWDHDTSALNAEVIDDELFLADVDAVEQTRRRMLETTLSRDDWDLLIWVSTAPDRVSHMFYRLIDPQHPRYDAAAAAEHGDAIEREYVRMDETIGAVLPQLRPNDTLLVLSDHGFHDYRRGLHVNQWLRQQGLLTLRGGAEGSTREWLVDVDWSQTKAYALGTGQIYFNLRGRERDGIVSEDEVAALTTRIREGLIALRDTERENAPVVTQVYVGREVFTGGRASDAPDLQVAFAENYRTSWETILGGVPAGLFADNDKKWSGDHAASDVRETPGILVSNRPLRDDVAIVDLAPTAVRFFERSAPPAYVGSSVLAP